MLNSGPRAGWDLDPGQVEPGLGPGGTRASGARANGTRIIAIIKKQPTNSQSRLSTKTS